MMDEQFPQNDDQFEDSIITEVSPENSGGWSITKDDGWSFFVPAESPVTPEEGMAVRMYGKGAGYSVRGLYLDGHCVFYRTESEDQEHRDNQMYGADAADLLRKWDAGDICHTIEMGGIGPGYEQAIHIMVFEIVRYMLANPADWARIAQEEEIDLPSADRYWPKYRDEMDKTLFAEGAPCQRVGPSGAQYGAACSLAAMFVRKGPIAVMQDESLKDRHIMVSRNFPSAA